MAQIELSATQQHTAQELLGILEQCKGQKVIVLLSGISGVGKTLLLDLLGQKISELGGSVARSFDLEHQDLESCRKFVLDAEGSLVCAVTRYEREQILSQASVHFKKWKFVDCILKGMDEAEIKAYISRAMPKGMKLSIDELASYSLGIPLLADDLLAVNLGKEHAIRLCVKYFFQSTGWTSDLRTVRGMAQEYLHMPLPSELFEFFSETVSSLFPYRSEKIYDELLGFRMVQREGLKHPRKDDPFVTEVNPIFVAPESERIYNQTLTSSRNLSCMHIYVPSMTSEHTKVVCEVLGMRLDHGYLDDTYRTRLGWFGASYRKVSFCFKKRSGRAMVLDHECDFVESLAELYRSRVASGKYSPLTGLEQDCEMLVEAHDHSDTPHNPIRLGWGVETLLQNQGVPYLVNNYMYGKLYVYNASTKHVVELGQAEEIPIWNLPRAKSRY